MLLPSLAMSASRVAVVDPFDSDAVLAEALVRLRAELARAGFEVVRVPAGTVDDVRGSVEQGTSAAAPAATLALIRVQGQAAIDVWVVDRVSGKTSVRRIEARATAEMVPAVLAIRAVDLLRASLLETILSANAPTKPVPRDLAALLPPPPEQRFQVRVAVDLGVGALESFQGLGPAVAPVLRLRASVHPRLTLRLQIGGPAWGARAQGAVGSADVRQELADFGAAFALLRGAVTPYVSAGLGAYHLDARGTASPPNRGKSGEAWAFACAASGGVAWRLTRHLALYGDLAAITTFPGITVDVGGSPAGRAGRPAFLASIAPSWSF